MSIHDTRPTTSAADIQAVVDHIPAMPRTYDAVDFDEPAGLPGRCRDDDEQGDRAADREFAQRMGWNR